MNLPNKKQHACLRPAGHECLVCNKLSVVMLLSKLLRSALFCPITLLPWMIHVFQETLSPFLKWDLMAATQIAENLGLVELMFDKLPDPTCQHDK